MRSLSTNAFGQPSETKLTLGAVASGFAPGSRMEQGASRDVRQDHGASFEREGSISAKEIGIIYPFRNASLRHRTSLSRAFWLSMPSRMKGVKIARCGVIVHPGAGHYA